MLTDTQKRTIQAIVNVFESGKPAGNYGAVTFSTRDVGCLTYGRSQTTLASGGLARLVSEYCNTTGAQQAEGLRPYLIRLQERDRALDSDPQFKSLLIKAGTDPAMHQVQDQFFDRIYWDPAIGAAQRLDIETPLGSAVVYDSFIHGAWARLRDATLARVGLPASESLSATPGLPSAPSGAPAAVGECPWVLEYITLRRQWLASHPNSLLRHSVYRMDTFLALAAAGNWDLRLPLEAHGVAITAAAVAPPAPAP